MTMPLCLSVQCAHQNHLIYSQVSHLLLSFHTVKCFEQNHFQAFYPEGLLGPCKPKSKSRIPPIWNWNPESKPFYKKCFKMWIPDSWTYRTLWIFGSFVTFCGYILGSDIVKVVHHRCQAIAFMFNGGSCSSFPFYPIDTYYWYQCHNCTQKDAARTIIMYYLKLILIRHEHPLPSPIDCGFFGLQQTENVHTFVISWMHTPLYFILMHSQKK